MNNQNTYFKSRRLKHYDYSSSGAYFLTLCTKNRKNVFWKSFNKNGEYELSENGLIADTAIQNISSLYENITVEKYAVMPDHIHILMVIDTPLNENRRALHAATVSKIVQQLKGYITKQIGFSVWQKSFNDHIIRNEYDFEEIYYYIDLNPIRRIEQYYRSVEHCSTDKTNHERK